jgi:hypothetical protein
MAGNLTKLVSPIILAAIAIATTTLNQPSQAATACPTYQEARKIYPGHHLMWKGNHCWGLKQAGADKREPSHAHNLKVAAEIDAAAKTREPKPKSRQHHVKLEDKAQTMSPERSAATTTAGDLERPAPNAPAAEIAFPAMKQSENMRPASLPQPVPWFTPYPMTSWPEIYDVDRPDKFKPWQNRIE